MSSTKPITDPPTTADEQKTRPRYDVACAHCRHEFLAAPSIAMEMGLNSGHAVCPACNEFLHLEITPDLDGDRMISQRHAEFMAAETERRERLTSTPSE